MHIVMHIICTLRMRGVDSERVFERQWNRSILFKDEEDEFLDKMTIKCDAASYYVTEESGWPFLNIVLRRELKEKVELMRELTSYYYKSESLQDAEEYLERLAHEKMSKELTRFLFSKDLKISKRASELLHQNLAFLDCRYAQICSIFILGYALFFRRSKSFQRKIFAMVVVALASVYEEFQRQGGTSKFFLHNQQYLALLAYCWNHLERSKCDQARHYYKVLQDPHLFSELAGWMTAFDFLSVCQAFGSCFSDDKTDQILENIEPAAREDIMDLEFASQQNEQNQSENEIPENQDLNLDVTDVIDAENYSSLDEEFQLKDITKGDEHINLNENEEDQVKVERPEIQDLNLEDIHVEKILLQAKRFIRNKLRRKTSI